MVLGWCWDGLGWCETPTFPISTTTTTTTTTTITTTTTTTTTTWKNDPFLMHVRAMTKKKW
jgi:hypothetical protein